MISFNFDVQPLVHTVNKTTQYYTDALRTLHNHQQTESEIAAQQVVSQAYIYFDSMAGSNPELYQHMYEFGMTGLSSGRLYTLVTTPRGNVVQVTSQYKEATVPTPESDQVFRRKAQALEEAWTFTISPQNSSLLVFEIDGETIFTPNSVTVTPGRELRGNFTNLAKDYMLYVAPRVIERVAGHIAKLRNIEMGAATLVNGEAAAMRDIRSADVDATSSK